MERKWPLGPDVVEECTAVAAMDEQDDWSPLFEPNRFNEEHKPLILTDYLLSEEELEVWGETCTAIREQISKKAARISQDESPRPMAPNQGRQGKMCGLKRSKPDHNNEGRTEADIRQQKR